MTFSKHVIRESIPDIIQSAGKQAKVGAPSERIILRSLILFLQCFLALAVAHPAAAFSQPDTSFHIYLMFGQSNMEGAGTIEAQDLVTNPRVMMMQDLTCPNLNRTYGEWYLAAPPLNRCWGQLGPGDSFGSMMGKEAPAGVTIGLINASVSGCNIYIYKKGCPDGLDQASQGIPFNCGYSWLLDLATRAQQVGVIKGILFHQGETNTGDPAWKYTVQQIVQDLKTDLGLGDIPFLAGELLYAEYNSCCSAHNVEINKLPGLIPNAHVISAAGLPGADYAHFTSASYRTLGERYAREMLHLVYNICDSSFIEPLYSLNNGALRNGNSMIVNRGTKLILSPAPENALGSWIWSGDGVSGSVRQLVITPTAEGSFKAMVSYTNECGAVSRLSYNMVVCDSLTIEPWYQADGGDWTNSATFCVKKGTSLVLSPRPVDTTGTWSWTGAGTSGTSREQNINTSAMGNVTAKVSYTNGCGASSHLSMNITVSDSTNLLSYYKVNDGLWEKSTSIQVNTGDTLLLSPYTFDPSGTWDWSGAGLTGHASQQIFNTAFPGTFPVQLTFTNSCGIESHLCLQVTVNAKTGITSAISWEKAFELYPNPASHELYIRNNNPAVAGSLLHCQVLNKLGQVVLSANVRASDTGYPIDIGKLEPASYFLRLIGPGGTQVRQFIKMK